MRKVLVFLLKLALVAACVLYAVWGADFAALTRAVAGYSPWRVGLIILYMVAILGVPGLRLRYLCGPGLSVYAGAKATALGLGLNNVFPAKLGEVAKAAYLSRHCGFSAAKGLGLVFWERFFDVNLIFCLAAVSLGAASSRLPIWPGLAAVGCAWLVIGALRVWPGLGTALLRLVPFERLRLFASELLHQLGAKLSLGFFARLAVLTILVWATYFLSQYLVLAWLADLPLAPGQILAVFVIGALGMAVPSSPGAIGVFEASIVFGLGLFGVPKGPALAAALVLHMIQVVPTTLCGLLVMARSGLRPGALRSVDDAADDVADDMEDGDGGGESGGENRQANREEA
ncbi:Lysylphosphatidylglycerol synthetase/glycosyltransferase AglD [Desulfovibrio sp. X2]|uniref:lysylphosphatidylglycerol synthase transmembrane domain-containing protein n=1 Tax=Desulfovibrio sp. X2 TaxID=941449 RepID=UPI000358E1B0|nr:lysylphosphatidylglycerol synthase transmembrane domain-containing protein [Desulfovibrio sp. X2]EPR37602.1 Lysylphosphatidylglycerol synthetase/glycosyltransferase AglD [Desulfovibrio sp. X2]